MKTNPLILLVLLPLLSCTHPKREQKVGGLPATLENTNSCFILYDLKNEKLVEVSNEERCQVRFPACSTFKVPLAVMGFDKGVLKGPNAAPYRWDKVQRSIEGWNKEQTVKTWMQNSVVWFSQQLTQELGRETIQNYLQQFNYGNEDFSGGLTDAWLTPAPFMTNPPKTSVLISGMEQVEFMKSLFQYKLPVSLNAMTQTQSILATEVSRKGSVLKGKTGSGYIGEDSRLRLGWFVAHLQSGNDEYISVMTFNDLEPQEKAGYAGYQAKEAMLQILLEKGLW